MERMKNSNETNKKYTVSAIHHNYNSCLRKDAEDSADNRINKKLRRIDKIFNFLEEFTMVSPFVGIMATTILYKINELHGAYAAYGYISNFVGVFLLPFSLLNLKKSRERLKERALKKYKRKQ